MLHVHAFGCSSYYSLHTFRSFKVNTSAVAERYLVLAEHISVSYHVEEGVSDLACSASDTHLQGGSLEEKEKRKKKEEEEIYFRHARTPAANTQRSPSVQISTAVSS